MRRMENDLLFFHELIGNCSVEKDSKIYTISPKFGKGTMQSFEVMPGAEIVYSNVHITTPIQKNIQCIDRFIEVTYCFHGRVNIPTTGMTSLWMLRTKYGQRCMRPIDETIEDIRRQAQLNRGKKITSCFLQDGDALVLKTDYLLRILEAINQSFPDMQYITSYARADSITRKSPAELKALRQAGLNHLYSGMETGSDQILKLINKGFDADIVVRSGCMAKEADMILSEFILLGIGGKELSEENAAQTAKALNIIQPDFIRVHATGIKPESKLGEFVRNGSFALQSEEEIVVEQKLFLQQLHEMDSYYVNEHIVNLLLEIRGNLRTEKQEMLSTIDRFLTLPPDERLLFAVGRRLNIFFRLDDLKKPKLHQKAEESLQQIVSKNPHVDFAALCNYVRQSQI